MIELKLEAPVRRAMEKVSRGERISAADAVLLWNEAPLAALGMLADTIKRSRSGNEVYYNRNFHIEPTNICTVGCRFCSYRRDAGSPEAWDYSIEEIEGMARARSGGNFTEVHIVGGVHPEHDLRYYAEMIRRVKEILPHVAVKAFTAVELAHMISKSGLSLEEGLSELKEAGMEAIPGGGAEIFDEEIRKRICPDKVSADLWLEVHETAHRLGIGTNATMLYGHIETPAHRIDHLDRLRSLQDRTGGFSAFIPLKYRSVGNSMSDAGEAGIAEDMRMLALSRIYLDNFPHIKAYWPMYGRVTAEIALLFGADDLDGTIDDTTKIYSMAGAEEQNPAMSAAEIEELILRAGYTPVERDTFYNKVEK